MIDFNALHEALEAMGAAIRDGDYRPHALRKIAAKYGLREELLDRKFKEKHGRSFLTCPDRLFPPLPKMDLSKIELWEKLSPEEDALRYAEEELAGAIRAGHDRENARNYIKDDWEARNGVRSRQLAKRLDAVKAGSTRRWPLYPL